jgi:hypothetical protein
MSRVIPASDLTRQLSNAYRPIGLSGPDLMSHSAIAQAPALADSKPAPQRAVPTPATLRRVWISVLIGISGIGGIGAFGAAQASRPLVTEDASVKLISECESDSYGGTLSEPHSAGIRTLLTQVSCGVGLRTELAMGYSELRQGDGTKRSLFIGGKTSLTEARDDHGGLSLAYGAPAVHEAGAGTHLGDLYATLAGSTPLAAELMLHMNLGWTGSHENSPHTTRWAAALDRGYSDSLHLAVETFADDHDHRPWLQLDASQKLGESMSLNASYGRQSHRTGARAVTLGFIVAL